MKRRILFLNRSYWPDTEATGQLLTDLAEDLTGRFDVEVLAGSPNHVTGAEFRHADLQQHNGVTIHRTRHSRFSKASKLGKLANLISFTGSAWWWQRRQWRRWSCGSEWKSAPASRPAGRRRRCRDDHE